MGGFSGSRVAMIILKYETQAAAARPDLALQFTPIKQLPYQQNKETRTITESKVNTAQGQGGMVPEEFNRHNVETGQLEETLTALYVRVSLNPVKT